MTVGKNIVENKKYELVPPDGGWGYMICAASTIIFIGVITFIPCFGLVYNDTLKDLGIESTGVTLLNGISSMSIAIGGYLSSPLLNILSLRMLSLLGVIIYNAGLLLLLFVNSKISFFICQGILQGIGIGMLLNLTFTIIHQYFEQKRLFAFSVIQTLTAIFAMFAPQLVKFSLNEYGYKGMLLVLTGVGLQAFIGVALFQPVEWHMKRLEVQKDNELEVFLLKENNEKGVAIVTLSDTERIEGAKSHNKAETDINKQEKSGFMKVLKDLFDVTTVKMVLTSVSSWALALVMFADMTYTLIMPQAFYADNWHEDDIATALSLAGFGDLATRGLFIILSNFLNKIGNQELYIIGMIISTIGKLGMLLSTNIIVVYIFIVLIGAGRCFLALLFPLVLADICPEKFSTILGISLIFIGLINVALGPVVGAIRDITDSYVITFYILTAMIVVCMVVWTMFLYKDKKRKNRVLNKGVNK